MLELVRLKPRVLNDYPLGHDCGMERSASFHIYAMIGTARGLTFVLVCVSMAALVRFRQRSAFSSAQRRDPIHAPSGFATVGICDNVQSAIGVHRVELGAVGVCCGGY